MNIYNKEQVDAQAIEVATRIKQSKATVTQELGESVALVTSQKLVTDNYNRIRILALAAL